MKAGTDQTYSLLSIVNCRRSWNLGDAAEPSPEDGKVNIHRPPYPPLFQPLLFQVATGQRDSLLPAKLSIRPAKSK